MEEESDAKLKSLSKYDANSKTWYLQLEAPEVQHHLKCTVCNTVTIDVSRKTLNAWSNKE